jgi:hypothetical protein
MRRFLSLYDVKTVVFFHVCRRRLTLGHGTQHTVLSHLVVADTRLLPQGSAEVNLQRCSAQNANRNLPELAGL